MRTLWLWRVVIGFGCLVEVEVWLMGMVSGIGGLK